MLIAAGAKQHVLASSISTCIADNSKEFRTSRELVVVSTRLHFRIRPMAAAGGKHRAVVLTKIDLEDPYAPVAVIEVPTPKLEAGEVLIRMEYRPIHPSDVLMLRGLYPGWIPKEGDFPKSLGHEGMGTIVEVGPGVTSLADGQRVYPFIPEEGPRSVQGTWQEYIAIPEQMCVPVPDQVSNEAAAQFFVNPGSAYFMVREFLPHAIGKYVVQSAAGSSLGRLFIQIAHHHGVKTINFVRRDELKADLKALGADEVINYAKEDSVARVKEITGGEMAFAGFDCVGGSITDLVMSCVREEGLVETYGIMGNEFPAPGLNNLMNRGVKLGGFYLSRQVNKLSPSEFQEFSANLMGFLKDGVVKFAAPETFSLDQASPAMIRSQAGGKVAKVMLVS